MEKRLDLRWTKRLDLRWTKRRAVYGMVGSSTLEVLDVSKGGR